MEKLVEEELDDVRMEIVLHAVAHLFHGVDGARNSPVGFVVGEALELAAHMNYHGVLVHRLVQRGLIEDMPLLLQQVDEKFQ